MALTARIILGALCQALQEPPPKRVDRRYDQTSAWIRPPRRAPFKERMPGRQCHKEPPHSGFGVEWQTIKRTGSCLAHQPFDRSALVFSTWCSKSRRLENHFDFHLSVTCHRLGGPEPLDGRRLLPTRPGTNPTDK